MGRQIENLMAHLAVEAARARGLRRVIARLIPTPRNGPCREFWEGSNFEEAEKNLFAWDATKLYPKPAFISIEESATGAVTP
jgi:predicted enzyme involved in methoxymalonyl-ACP biosynthesis